MLVEVPQNEDEFERHQTLVHILNEKFMFKHRNPFLTRQQWSKEAVEKYPDKIQVIIEKDLKCVSLDELGNPKFLMPNSFAISEVQMILRRKLNLSKEQAVFLLVRDGKELVRSNMGLQEVYAKYQDNDGFLYMLYTEETTFG